MIAGAASAAALAAAEATAHFFATAVDIGLGQRISAREANWRCGAIVYQVIVDRFAPSASLEANSAL